MEDLGSALAELADANYSGAPFLGAYGVTWLVCALLWHTRTPRVAAFATLFQGTVALPVALGISAALGMFDERPGGPLLAQLGVLVSMSQLLVLPLLIVLVTQRRYTAVPLVFAITAAIHFVPYAWLYQSVLYLVMPVVVAVGLAIVAGIDRDPERDDVLSASGAGRVCALTGVALLATGVAAVVLSG
ncbi:hypothetical protein C8046_11575 [Serinibacter arcticus]|uniref:Integral membrane protein n=1 Tax=Serinibacter arcticus TaxID=1655435 RepID=A0A2U1ZW93_9MICO|nr:hypothetical protein [Serinibacter arcticus]PWD51192.1 hypothetical protein C8046_11575 [Serinibacter arcticus]